MKKSNLTSMALVIMVLLLVQVSVCRAYNIDGDLADWGVTPFSIWAPGGDADYVQTNNVNFYGAGGYSEPYDWEALYFDDDEVNFYFAGVSSYRVGEQKSSDLGIDLNGDFVIGAVGNVTGLEYAIQMDDNFGELSVNPTWLTSPQDPWNQGRPHNATGGTVLGSATVVIKHYPSMESGTYIFEAAVPRHLFHIRQNAGQPVSVHMATYCGNDSINLTGDINTTLPAPEIDIRCDREPNGTLRLLADDFERSEPGIVTKVVLWGSWKDDNKGQIKKIHLSFHNDIPADACDPCSYSRPGRKLWSRDFGAGEFSETLYADQANPEWFWDPATGQAPDTDSDYEIWQYEIPIYSKDAFSHGGSPSNPAIYWLDVYVELEPDTNNPQFGWKTTKEHFNDDAVWSNNDGLTWHELLYPPEHIDHPNSIDLAFVIKSEKPPIQNLKWSQPPIEIDPNAEESAIYCGWDEPSWRRYKFNNNSIWFSAWDCNTQCHGDADCSKQGTPMTGYWRVGTYDLSILVAAWQTNYPDIGYDPRADFNRDLKVDYEDIDILTKWWEIKEPPQGGGVPADCPGQQPIGNNELWKVVADDFRCLGTMPITSIHWWGSYVGWEGPEAPLFAPVGWRIGFWSNVDPCGTTNFSRPRELLWQIEVEANRVYEVVVGNDSFPAKPYDTCFQYNVELEPNEIFRQDDYNSVTEDDIYWISIAAIYPDGIADIEYPWGWKTRPQHWMDDAVRFEMKETPQTGMMLDPCDSNMTPIKDSTFGPIESYDMAFELGTDPDYIKWEQAYDGFRYWDHYEDELSMARPESNIIGLVADDWRCERRTPVTAVVWWGSYIGYGYEACSSQQMTPPVPPDRFKLKIWTDVPAGGPEGKVDVLFLTDTTSSMSGYIDNLKAAFSGILSTISTTLPGLDIEYSVADYKNYYDGGKYTTYGVNLKQPFTSDIGEVQDAIIGLSVAGGGDGPESQLKAMVSIADNWLTLTGDLGFKGRTDAQKILIWAGDYPGHIADDSPPDYYPTLDDTITALTTHDIMVFAMNTKNCSTGINEPYGTPPHQQADDITFATGGTLFCSVGAGGPSIEDAIITAITSGIGYSHPGEVIWQYDANEYDEVQVGYDKYPHGEPNEPVFRYSVKLPEEKWFRQPDVNGIFWLSVVAVYDLNVPNYNWGWTNHKHVFNDDAVSGYYDDVNEVWVWTALDDQTGESEDMSFMLFTDPNECVICANYNLDGIINFSDYVDFADDWHWVGPAGGYNNSDLNCDGKVDYYDLQIFVSQWVENWP